MYGVYTANFQFLDSTEAKVRPVIVVSSPQGRYGVTAVVPVSSRAEREAVDVAISGWNEAGLIKASVARVHRLTTMLETDLVAYLGELHGLDVGELQGSMRRFLNL